MANGIASAAASSNPKQQTAGLGDEINWIKQKLFGVAQEARDYGDEIVVTASRQAGSWLQSFGKAIGGFFHGFLHGTGSIDANRVAMSIMARPGTDPQDSRPAFVLTADHQALSPPTVFMAGLTPFGSITFAAARAFGTSEGTQAIAVDVANTVNVALVDFAVSGRSGVVAAESAPEFVGPLIGKSGFRTSGDFAEAVGTRYQGYVDDAYVVGQKLESQGLLRGNPNTRLGDYVDRTSARRLGAYLNSEGGAEGPNSLVQMNRWLRDPAGSGLYVRPDVRISAAGRIYDATVGFKAYNSTQITRFGQYSGGDRITVVRPSPLGSYSIVP